MHALTHLLSRTKKKLLDWRKIGLSSLNKEIKIVEHHISCLENEDHGMSSQASFE